jgi:hypothetical protein
MPASAVYKMRHVRKLKHISFSAPFHMRRREHNKKHPRLKEIISAARIVNNYNMLCFRLPSGDVPPAFRTVRSH